MPEEPTLEETTARMIIDDLDPLAKKVKEINGTPYGVANLSPDRELWAFNYQDTTVDPHALRAAGMSDAEIADHMFPLRSRLREQAGFTFDDHQKYTDRLVERSIAAQQAGRPLKPPPRGPGKLSQMPDEQPMIAVPIQQPAPTQPAPDPTQMPPGGM